MDRSNSIRSRMTVFAAAVAVTSALVGLLVVRSELRLARDLEEQKVTSLARITASAISQFVDDTRLTLEGMASQVRIRSMDPDECARTFESAHQILGQYTSLLLTDPDGTAVCGVWGQGGRAQHGFSVAGVEWWDLVTHPDSGFIVGPPQVGRGSGEPIAVFAAPVVGDDGQRIGYVGASVNVNRIRDIITSPERPEGTIISVARYDGLVVARSEAMDEWVGRILPGSSAAQGQVLSASRAGFNVTASAEGQETMWAFHATDRVPWAVYAGTPLSRIQRTALAAAAPQLALLLLLLFTPLLLVVRLRRDVGSALGGLVEGVREASTSGRGVEVQGPAEFRELARQFNATLQAREAARQAQEAAQARTASIVENAAFGIFAKDANGIILEANPALARILGAGSPDELVGRFVGDFYQDGDTRREILARIEAGERSLEFHLRAVDGRLVPVRGSWTRLPDAVHGAVYEVMVEDLTERYQLEQQIRQSQKLEAVGRLAGGVAHDFNNRLTVISGHAEFILEELEAGDPMRDQAAAILRSAQRSAELTAQLLAFSRRQMSRPRAIDLTAVVEGMRPLLERLLGLEVGLAFEPGPTPQVRADPGQVEQVVMNLCTNARDAMDGTGTITITTGGRRLSEGDARTQVDAQPGDYAVLAVEDTGHGMDAATQERIFEPFFTTKPQGKGTGLGLSTVYGITAQSGGHLRVHSWPGRGTRVEVWLPGVEPTPSEAVSPAPSVEPSSGPRGRGETLLVVEDEEPVRRIITDTLRRAGYRIREAASAEQALQMMDEAGDEIDLLVTDIVMPGASGTELAARIRARFSELPILYLSGYTDDPPELDEAARRGLAFLAKPFARAALRERVRRLLDDEGTPGRARR